LEKVEIGGIKGKMLSHQVVEIFEEFTEYFAVFGNRTYDGLDATNKVCVQRIIGYIFLVTPDQLEMTP
jgi:predicted small integral membrane protein